MSLILLLHNKLFGLYKTFIIGDAEYLHSKNTHTKNKTPEKKLLYFHNFI